MLPDWLTNPGLLTYELGALPIALRGPAKSVTSNSRIKVDWFGLFGCFTLNGPLQQYFSLYKAVSQREGERKKKR